MAETYHVLNLWELPVEKAAVLAAGLREDSRIRLKLAGMKTDFRTMLEASLLDSVNTSVWMRSEDGRKRRNRPKSVLQILVEGVPEKETVGFIDSVEFEAERARLLGGVTDGD